MRRRVRRQAALGLRQLALAADPVPPSCLIPGDGDVNESLEEVPLRRFGSTPGVLERLVRGEVLAASDLLKPEREPVRNKVRLRS